MSIQHIGVGLRASRATVHGGMLFSSGLVAEDSPGTSVTQQTEEILTRVEALLAEAGSDKKKLLSVTIWLSDYRSFDEMNRVWDAWVPRGATPARACVEARLSYPDASPRYDVEIAVVAAV